MATYDIFICHASEDKDFFVRPLANALADTGLNIWYDEFSLSVGDSLRRSIDYGLANSRFGVVVFSPHFFKKEWPAYELDGLVSKATSAKQKVILPVWHCVDRGDVERFAPSLADKIALNSASGIEQLVQALRAAVSADSRLPSTSQLVLSHERTDRQPARYVRCAKCDGDGLCPECEGHGKKVNVLFGILTAGIGFFDRTETCSLCNGSKKCPVCNGAGKVTDDY